MDVNYLGNGFFIYVASGGSKFSTTSVAIGDIHVLSCSAGEEYAIPDIVYAKSGYQDSLYICHNYLATVLENSDYAHLEQSARGKDFNTIIINISTGEILSDLGEDVSSIGEYSDGGFVYEQDGQLYFFDCSTRDSTAICLEDADKFDGGSYQFVDGEMTIRLSGADGNTYYATVDKSGNYITEPHLNN